uniref:Microtubule-associated protein n=1 Tax=Denticeps clupeoides TaxID=299321 RepID=A0AAY4DEG9_9TELE
MADLSLTDALTDSAPQSGPENLVERDFVAQLEAESFDDQVGETVGKSDFVPLMDNDDAAAVLENGGHDAQGAQKPGTVSSLVAPGGLLSASRPEPQGEVRPRSSEQQASVSDFLPGSMAGFSDQWHPQPNASQMTDSSLVGTFSGFSQPAVGMEMSVGVAPLPLERPPSIAEPQFATPKDLATSPRILEDMSGGVHGWPEEAVGPTDLPFTPSVSTVISRHAGHLAESTHDPLDPQWSPRESGVGAADEREYEAADHKQKRKKKRRPREDIYDLHGEGKGQAAPYAENTPPYEDSHQSPRKDGVWEREEGGHGAVGRVKKPKTRKKIPEEWAVSEESFVPTSPSYSHNFSADLTTSSSAGDSEVIPEVASIPPSLTQDLLSLTATSPPSSSDFSPDGPLLVPLKKGSSPKEPVTSSPMPEGSFSTSFQDPFRETSSSCIEYTKDPFSLQYELDKPSPKASPMDPTPFLPDSGVYEQSIFMQDPSFVGTSPDPPGPVKESFVAFQSTGLELPMEALISAPPFSPSGAVWSHNDSQQNHHNNPFGLMGVEGMEFDTMVPTAVASPKEKPPKETHRQNKKTRSSSSKSPTSPGMKSPTAQNSGLNPAAPPFFPSFVEPQEPMAMFPVGLEDKMEKTDKPDKKEKMDNFDMFGKMEKAQKTEDKVEMGVFAKPEELQKMEKEEKLDKAEKMDMFNKVESKDEAQKDNPDKDKPIDSKEKTLATTEPIEVKGNVEKMNKVESADSKEKMGKMDEVELVSTKENVDKVNKTESGDAKENMNKVDKVEPVNTKENVDKVNKTESGDAKEKMNKVEPDNTKENVDKVNKLQHVDAKEMMELLEDKTEKAVKTEKVEMVEKNEKVKATADMDTGEKVDVAQKVEEEKAKVEPKVEEKAQKEEKVEKEDVKNKDKAEKANKDEKKDSLEKKTKTTKVEKDDKTDKAKKPGTKPASTNGSSVPPSKDLTSADKKAKPVAGATKPGSVKPRPSSASAGTAAPKRPTPTSAPSATTSTTLSKKAPLPKAPIPSSGTKRTPSAASRPPSSTTSTTTNTTAPREVKPKTITEKRPAVPKPPAAPSAPRNGTSNMAATKTATANRTLLTTRTTASTPSARRPTAKTESRPGEEKSSTLKGPDSSTRPKTTMAPRTSTAASSTTVRTRTSKPASTSAPSTAPERKPPVPRVPRVTSSTSAATKTTPRPGTAPTPDIRNARSKIGSTDNMKHQPGGGKVTASSKTDSKETSQGKVQIVSKKVDYSHVTSRLGSKDNMKHVPGGGNVQILNKKVDLSKVTSKCGSKINIKHKPGGGDVKIESHKLNFKDKAQSKVGSMDNVTHEPGGGNVKAEGTQETAEGSGAPSSGAPAAQPEDSPAQENGLKEGAPCGSEGLRDPQGLDSRIPETN